jgi:tetratricopeptide (TPR) repeat protein
VLIEMGNFYFNIKDYQTSKKYYNLAHQVFKKIANPYGEALVCTNFALIYKSVANYDSAVYFFTNSLSIRCNIGDSMGCLATYYHLIGKYSKLKQFDKTFLYANNAKNIVKQVKPTPDILYLYDFFDNIYAATLGDVKKFDQGRRILDSLLKLPNIEENFYRFGEIVLTYGNLEKKAGNYKLAEKYFQYYIDFIKERTNAFPQLKTGYQLLYVINLLKGDSLHAFKNKLIERDYSDSIEEGLKLKFNLEAQNLF